MRTSSIVVVVWCWTTQSVLSFLSTTTRHGSSATFCRRHVGTPLWASTVEAPPTASSSSPLAASVLEYMQEYQSEAQQWSQDFGFSEDDGVGEFYSLFRAIRQLNPLGLTGQPFVLRHDELVGLASFAGYFTFEDLAQALQDDFLDAGRGSTDNRKGWKMTTVSQPRGNSFEEARMTLEDVESALEKGTVIFNSAGAHIPKLAAPTLASVDATALPNAVNMYVTAPGKRTSAPPHTDKQDVVVVQTSGAKRWRVYTPPNPHIKPSSDIFARGKGNDNLPIFSLEPEYGCELLLDITLQEGDVLFVPAAFPHTTGTAEEGLDKTSIHMTFGLDNRIWDLDYLSLRFWALQRANVLDTKLLSPPPGGEGNRYVGIINELPLDLHQGLLEGLPMGFLEDNDDTAMLVESVVSKAEKVSRALDETTASGVDSTVWKEATERVRQHGMEMLDIHRDMYLSAIEEGRLREAERAMTAHLDEEEEATTRRRKTLTPEQMQRLSVFRVKNYFDKIEVATKGLIDWGQEKSKEAGGASGEGGGKGGLPDNWEFSLPVEVGDKVEADLGGAFFEATVTAVNGDKYDVLYFDGDRDTGLGRNMIKLLNPPEAEEEVDTSSMTPKQLKRWKKQQAKKQKK